MKQFKECIIHIETDKTGTKSLQWFFKRNEINLWKNKILYPEVLRVIEHPKDSLLF